MQMPYVIRTLFRGLVVLLGSLCMCFVPGLMAAEIKVTITGVDKTLETVLRESVVLSRRSDLQQATPASIRALYIRSLDEIGSVLESHGYYDYRLTDRLHQEGEDWIAEFVIEPGEPIRIQTVNVRVTGDGMDDPEFRKAIEQFPLKIGNVFNHAAYESGKRRLETVALDRGYFDREFTSRTVRIDRPAHSAVIDLILDSGRRYRFGEVDIPETVIDSDILRRYQSFQPDSYYDSLSLIRFGQNLRDSKYFDEAIVTAGDPGDQGRVPIQVSLTPRPQRDIRIGAGYGTDSGPRLVASWDYNYVNRRGHRLDTDMKLSRTISQIGGIYVMPDFLSNGADLDLLSSLSTEKTDTSISDAFRLGAQLNHTRFGWNETLGLTYRHEAYKVADVGDTSDLLTPEISYWHSSPESSVYTRSGYRINLGLKGALAKVLSNTTFLQFLASGKYILPVGDRSRWITRADVGASYVPEFEELPASLRFFAGGDNSIRGFDLEQLGPTNSVGEIIGGKYLATGSLEFETVVKGNWSAAVFTDFGNAFNHFSDHFVYSVGTGVRWKTPVGLLRVDIAAGISEDDIPYRLHLNLGPDL